MSWCGDVWIYHDWVYCASWIYRFMFFIRFWKYLAIISSNFFVLCAVSPLPLGICLCIHWWCWMVFHRSLRLYLFLFFYLVWSNNLNWPIFKFADSFVWWFFFLHSQSAAKPLLWIFHCSFYFFKKFLYLILFICWNIVLLVSFSSLFMVSLKSLSIFDSSLKVFT